MGILEVLKNHKPIENPEFGQRKKLIGDAVAQVQSLTRIESKKNASPWIILRCEAINVIPDPKGRETTVLPGDEITKLYNANDPESLEDMDNDLFTAGIEFNREVSTEEELLFAMAEATKNKLIYFRTWARDKNEEQLEKNPNPPYFQNIIVKSKNLVTAENSVPQLPF